MHPNGDTSTSNYNSQYLFGLDSSAGATATTHAGLITGFAATNFGSVSYGQTFFYARSGNGARSARTTYSQGVSGSHITATILHDTVWNNSVDPITSLSFSSSVANGIGIGSRIEIWAKRSWSGQSQWNTNGPNIHLPAGNVGIGTSTPNTKLVVSGGNITAPNQTFFEAKLCSSVVGPGGTMVWETEITDTTSSYNNATGVFTAPVTGVYQFGFNTLMNYAGAGEYRYGFHKNGALENITIEQKAASTWKTIQGTWTTRLNAGETVSVVYGFGVGNTYNDCSYNRFWGRLEN